MRFFCVILIVCFSSALLFGGDPSRNHDIAQVGDGGGIRTVFWISNGNSDSVKLTLELFADDGKPLEIELDGTRASKFEITVAAKGTRKLSTPGTGSPVKTGWARLQAEKEVGAQALFEIVSSGNLVTQAAVESAGPLLLATMFLEKGGGRDTGIAIANLSQGKVRVRLTLRDENGQVVAIQDDLELPALGHLARFAGELFPNAQINRGSLTLQATGTVTVITLQQTGLVLGTLPVISVLF